MNIITKLYYLIIRKPTPKFEIGDVVRINPKFETQLIGKDVDLEAMKMMVVLETEWKRKTGYMVHVDTCVLFSSVQQIHESWLELRKLN